MAAERVLVAEVTVRVFDRGPEPEWHTDRRLFGPWCRFEAELVDDGGVRALGDSRWEALYGLVANHRQQLNRREVAS
jgi:hypothetical protein